MYLRALTLREFAGVSSLALDSFEDGLNVIVGDNEAGKSTVLTALRAAFFQKHRSSGEATRALVPYGGKCGPRSRSPSRSGAPTTSCARPSCRSRRPSCPGRVAGFRATRWRSGWPSSCASPIRARASRRRATSSARSAFSGSIRAAPPKAGPRGRARRRHTASLEGEVSQVLGGDRGARAARRLARPARTDSSPRRFASRRTRRCAKPRSGSSGCARTFRSVAAPLADYRAKLQRLSDRRSVLRSYEKDDAPGRPPPRSPAPRPSCGRWATCAATMPMLSAN